MFLLLTLYVAYKIYMRPNGIDIDKNKFPITGIDISKHTGKVEFNLLKKQGIDFIYVKATEGKTFTDVNFKKNFQGAKSVKIPVGVYHFYRFNRTGAEQAEHFLSSVRFLPCELPPVVDVEEWGNVKTDKPVKQIVSELKDFIRDVEETTCKKVMIYTNENGYDKYVAGNFPYNDIWICSFNNKPMIETRWTMWQHSHKGEFRGIEKKVDVNTFNGNGKKWAEYLEEVNNW